MPSEVNPTTVSLLVVSWLAKFRPEIFWRRHGLIVRGLAGVGRLEALKVVKGYERAAMEAFEWGEIQNAAEKGWFEVVKYLHEEVGVFPTYETLAMAAGSGNLEMVKYLHGVGAECADSTLNHAFSSGNVEIVRFILEHCQSKYFESPNKLVYEGESRTLKTKALYHWYPELEDRVRAQAPAFLPGAVVRAAEEGYRAKIQELCSIPFIHIPFEALKQAAAKGHWDIVRFLVALPDGMTSERERIAAMEAATFGNLETFKFVFERSIQNVPHEAFARAADEGHFDIVKFYHENHPKSCQNDGDKSQNWSCADSWLDPVSDRMFERNDAAVMEVYRYLVELCKSKRDFSIHRFMERQQLDLVELLAPHVDPFHGLGRAAGIGYLDGVKVMMKYWPHEGIDLYTVLRTPKVDVVRYLMGTGRFDIKEDRLPRLAQKSRCVEKLKFIVENKPDANLLDTLSMALATWNLEAFRFLQKRIPASQLSKWRPGNYVMEAVTENGVKGLHAILSIDKELDLEGEDIVGAFEGEYQRVRDLRDVMEYLVEHPRGMDRTSRGLLTMIARMDGVDCFRALVEKGLLNMANVSERYLEEFPIFTSGIVTEDRLLRYLRAV
ncbi:hypothetical protein HDU97_008401 [Phlyctochytrium planicorne]|nr:hypothetical protein HDU97_008401 [Phlyctochytrium planicorne]